MPQIQTVNLMYYIIIDSGFKAKDFNIRKYESLKEYLNKCGVSSIMIDKLYGTYMYSYSILLF